MHDLCQRKIAALKQLAGKECVLKVYAGSLLSQWEAMDAATILPQPEALLTLMHETRRIEQIYAAGQQDNATLWADIQNKADKVWGTDANANVFVAPNRKLTEALAKQLARGISLKPEDHVQLNSSYFCRDVVHAFVENVLRQGNDFEIGFADETFALLLRQASDKQQLENLLEWYKAEDQWLQKSVAIRDNNKPPETKLFTKEEKKAIADKWKEVAETFSRASGARRTNSLDPRYTPWTLTYLPTEHEAKFDGMDYEAYKTLFFEACDQPWDAIDVAQRKLIDVFNKSDDVHITNSDGTDVRFSIQGHSFANSGAIRNIPGAEFFSAPVKESVQGKIVAKGKYKVVGEEKFIEDMTLEMKDGRIESWDAKKGKDELTKIVTKGDKQPKTDANGAPNPLFEGTRYFGEIGIGTNPHLQSNMVNGLLVEKISGSFHMAIGKAYGDGYLDDPSVKLDNGNRAPEGFHWDITTMLRPDKTNPNRTSEMWLDGHLVQKDGRWQAVPELGISEDDVAVLNDGWLALKQAGKPIPKYWDDKLAVDAKAAQAGR